MSVRTQKIVLIILLGLILIYLCVLAAVPPVNRDALTHHLLVPKLYLIHGGIYEIPEIPFSYYPMLLDYLYMAGMHFANDIVPAYIHMVFALLTAAGIFVYLRNRYTNVWGLIGALFFLTIPVIVRLSTTAYVDLGVIFFAFGSLLFMLKWHDTNGKWRYLILSAVFCGLALGTKYNGIIDFLILTAFVPVLYAGMKRRQQIEQAPGAKPRRKAKDDFNAIGCAAAFAVIALVVFSPWAIKNYVWTANPVYPLAQSIFNSDEAADKDIFGNTGKEYQQGTLAMRWHLYGESTLQIMLVPLRVFFEGWDDNPQYFDGRLNPALLIFAVIGLLFIRKRDLKYMVHDGAFISYTVLVVILVWLTASMRIRYISSMIPFITILSIVGMRSLLLYIQNKRLASGNTLKFAVKALICVAFLGNLFYMAWLFEKVEPVGYLTGTVSRDEYIAKHRPEYPVLVYANQEIPQGSGIMAVFLGNRMYYSDHLLTMSHMTFFRYLAAANSAVEAAEKMQADGYDYLIVDLQMLTKYAGDFLSSRGLMNLQDFIRHCCEIMTANEDFYLLKIEVPATPMEPPTFEEAIEREEIPVDHDIVAVPADRVVDETPDDPGPISESSTE